MPNAADLLNEHRHTVETSNHQVTGPSSHTPHLELEEFSGPLERMLVLARAQKLDLAKLSLRNFLEQLIEALTCSASINRKAEWVGMAAWVVLLRSRLLLPASPAAELQAEADAQELQARLLALQEMQALTAWLTARPQLGQDVFARGAPEMLGTVDATNYFVDVVELIWATIEFLDDAVDEDPAVLYRVFALDLHKVSEARARIFWRVIEPAEHQFLEDLVPAASGFDPADPTSVRRYKSGWTATFTAALEMAKQGEVQLAQDSAFEPIGVATVELAFRSDAAGWRLSGAAEQMGCDPHQQTVTRP